METGPWCNICQCILYEMERILFLCFSTFQCHSSLFTENRTGPSDWCTPSSNLVDPTLVLLHLWVDYTVLLPRSHHLLIQPHNHALHPLREHMKLTARKLSGKAYCREMFQTRLHKSSSSPGPQGHRSSTSLASRNGLFFLANGRVILTTHLWQRFCIFWSVSMTRDCRTPPLILPGVPYQPLLY